jgi:hypothetical protein
MHIGMRIYIFQAYRLAAELNEFIHIQLHKRTNSKQKMGNHDRNNFARDQLLSLNILSFSLVLSFNQLFFDVSFYAYTIFARFLLRFSG